MTGHGSSLVRPRASLTKVTFFFFLEGEASINTGHCEFGFFFFSSISTYCPAIHLHA
jgi:hypothetical protein